jgi:pimeloyl-ACP methyl ester carboxylesterase
MVTIVILITAVILGTQWTAYTPPILDQDGKPLLGSITSLETVTLGDSKQWISIRGKDINKPVLLFLAGGPGGTQLAATRIQLKGLEDHFVVVNWEQPGAGKSYNSVPRNSLTPERYINDAHTLTEYLCHRFDEEKIYVVGESWGSVLGIWLVQRYPERFHAFVGTGQMVDFKETEIIDYELAIKLAGEEGNTKLVEKLKKQGIPPYYGDDVTLKGATYLMYLSAYMTKNPDIHRPGYQTLTDMAGPEYGLYDKVNYVLGVLNTFNHVYQQLYDFDLRKQAVKLEVPVYILQGRHDINAPAVLVEEYFEKLQAPKKELIWFEHSGHSPWINERERFVDTLVNVVLKNTQQ